MSTVIPMPFAFTPAPLKTVSGKRAVVAIAVLSVVVLAFLVWLVYFKGGSPTTSATIRALPAVNATLNSLSACFLIAAFIAVMRRHYRLHMRLMLAALTTSALFFVCYVVYHNAHGDTKFPTGTGIVRPIYFAILISHIMLSAIVVPMILGSFYLSLSGKLTAHRRLSRVTLPIWLYVSVTGVVVFAMLKHYVG